jgi:hypothetical protein
MANFTVCCSYSTKANDGGSVAFPCSFARRTHLYEQRRQYIPFLIASTVVAFKHEPQTHPLDSDSGQMEVVWQR